MWSGGLRGSINLIDDFSVFPSQLVRDALRATQFHEQYNLPSCLTKHKNCTPTVLILPLAHAHRTAPRDAQVVEIISSRIGKSLFNSDQFP
jgi:hypothetical protein